MGRHSWAYQNLKSAALFTIGMVFCYSSIFAAPASISANRAIVNAVKRLRPVVVHIRAKREVSGLGGFSDFFQKRQKEPGSVFPFGDSPSGESVNVGAGVILSKDGYILTNHHVIEDAEEIEVQFIDGSKFSGHLIGVDDKTDLALLRVNSDRELPTAVLGDSDKLEVGEWVIAVGSPFGLPQSVSVGIVSALSRNLGQGPYDDYIQTDASINPGSSGGPLSNSRGEIIGINTAIFTRGKRTRDIGVGFAIPINQAKSVVDDLRHKGYPVRGRLGVSVGEVPYETSRKLGLARFQGAILSEVIRGGPADQAGLRRGDVIVEFDGKSVVTWQTLPRLVARARPNELAEVKYYRSGKIEMVRVRVGSRRDGKAPANKTWDQLGMKVESITPQLASQFNIEETNGLVISAIKAGGLAERGGVRTGDRIVEVNHKSISNYSQFRQEIQRSSPEGYVLLLLRRKGTEIFAVVRFP